MHEDPIIERIARELAQSGALEALTSALAPTDLQSLMLHVYRERSAQRTPALLLSQYERSALVQPSSVDGRGIAQAEQIALECARDFEALELAPVAPLGTNRVLGGIDQNRCLATVRGAEVLADPTTVLALECARRRHAGVVGSIRLCSRARQLRMQRLPGPGFTPHFALFAMVTAGRDRGDFAFELESLREHLTVYVRYMERLTAVGYRFAAIDVAISETSRDQRRLHQVQAQVLEPLSAQFPHVQFRLDPGREQARQYYSGLCLSLNATDARGERMNLGDGGCTDWTRRLLANAKERLLVSALGLELMTRRFRENPTL